MSRTLLVRIATTLGLGLAGCMIETTEGNAFGPGAGIGGTDDGPGEDGTGDGSGGGPGGDGGGSTSSSSSSSSASSTSSASSASSSSSSSSSGGAPPECGDGVIGGTEECDGAALGGASCVTLGWDTGTLVCGPDCTLDTSGCEACGNDVIEGDEECDGTDLPPENCTDHGFFTGTLGCDDTCMLDTSTCHNCGNDIIDEEEDCEDGDLASQTCESLGFLSGTLACQPDCRWDWTLCVAPEYLDDFEGGSLGADYVTSGDAAWVVDGTDVIAGSFSAHSPTMTDSQVAILELTLLFPGDGTISFSHKEDTESNYDELFFYIDGVEQEAWSGSNVNAPPHVVDVPSGMHSFRWIYDKDGSISTGADRVWIDDLVATGGRIPP